MRGERHLPTKSPLSIALMCTIRRRIPASTSAQITELKGAIWFCSEGWWHHSPRGTSSANKWTSTHKLTPQGPMRRSASTKIHFLKAITPQKLRSQDIVPSESERRILQNNREKESSCATEGYEGPTQDAGCTLRPQAFTNTTLGRSFAFQNETFYLFYAQ